ncbi:hypothetical protein FS749_010654 [Ceratobasidium sp. UAMH 11750]|nr:hypothetical protein FS749_010654 [Ceratobasidium sp. UAMH 11750]
MRRLVCLSSSLQAPRNSDLLPSFVQTNQTAVLDTGTHDLPSIVSGMREICSLASVLLGGTAASNSQVASSSTAAPTPTATSGAVGRIRAPGLGWLSLIAMGGLVMGIMVG